MTDPSPLQQRRLAIISAHPGHELRLFGWMRITKPLLMIITDGSGGAAAPRLHYSAALAAACGARPGRVFGNYTDQEVYRWLIEGDFSAVSQLSRLVAQELDEHAIDAVLCDAYEGYNPVHDLTSAIALSAASQSARRIVTYHYPLDGPQDRSLASPAITLSDADFADKLHAAASYLPLQHEVDQTIQRYGLDEMRREVLQPFDSLDRKFENDRPYYETYGEQQVAAGRYRSVLRYAEHMMPMLEKLSIAPVHVNG